jgi:hypothetical protein
VSEEVLDGLRGVQRVYSHFVDPYEANTVWYDPALINIEQMEKALKDAAVYLGTVNKKMAPSIASQNAGLKAPFAVTEPHRAEN